jgi:hypothetical protein
MSDFFDFITQEITEDSSYWLSFWAASPFWGFALWVYRKDLKRFFVALFRDRKSEEH